MKKQKDLIGFLTEKKEGPLTPTEWLVGGVVYLMITVGINALGSYVDKNRQMNIERAKLGSLARIETNFRYQTCLASVEQNERYACQTILDHFKR